MYKYSLLPMILLLATISIPAVSATNKNLELRINRLERMLDNNSQYQLLSKIKQLKEENRELRGLVEEQSNQIKKLERRIRSLNSDMDRRVSTLEADAAKNLSTQPPLSSQTTATQTPSTRIDQSITPTVSSSANTNPENQTEATDSQTQTTGEDNASKLLAERQYAEQQAYQKAFEQLKALRYSKAQQSFNAFLQQYPDGRYAHIAQYWLAESNYAQRKFKQAIQDYQKLLDKHKNSPKKAEAFLKIAYCHYELGDKKKTSDTLKTLIKRYPGTTESGQAKRLLKRL